MTVDRRAEVRRLRRLGWAYARIAERLDISYAMAWRLASPEHEVAAREHSRRWKHRHQQNGADGRSQAHTPTDGHGRPDDRQLMDETR